MPGNKAPLIYAFLILVSLVAFWPVTHADFISIDDNEYITENRHVQNGLTLEGVRWAFATGHAANWHPVTWLSHMLDVQFFGLNPHRHHVINLLFHVANSALLFLALHRMTKALWQSAFVAALFALHPLHVESVAWVAERKDVLSTLFWMLTLCAYYRYAEHRSVRRYLPVLIFLALGLMAKPMLVTLPFVLLLLDYWPLKRLAQSEGMVPDDQRWHLRELLAEKIPLFVLAAISCVVTYLVQQHGGAVGSIERLPLEARIANGFVSYIAYIVKTIWPAKLAFFYPYERLLPAWQVLAAAVLFTALTFAVVAMAKRYKYLPVGWLWYAGTLVPVIGLVQVGYQGRADRYTYIPLIGLFIMVAWLIPEVLSKWRHSRKLLIPLSALILLCCFIVTRTQTMYWQNSFVLFDHALEVTRNNDVAYVARGNAYEALGNYAQAINDYGKALKISPGIASAYNNRGVAYAALGDQEQAIKDYDRATEIDPRYGSAFANRGMAYAVMGYHEKAIEDYNRAIEINPRLAAAYLGRAASYHRLNDEKRAYEDLKNAAALGDKTAQLYLQRTRDPAHDIGSSGGEH